MPSSSLRASVLTLVLLARIAIADTVSLSSFVPRVENLPSACSVVYGTAISGCEASDFVKGATCSAACVRGLVVIAESVKESCANVDAGELSIIGVFQNGLGIASLCPGVTVVTSSSSTTAGGTQQTSTEGVAITTVTSSRTEETSTAGESTTEAEDDDPSSTEESSSSPTGGLTLDPDATGTVTITTIIALPTDSAQPSSIDGAVETAPPNAQLSNADSGGGSPFDVIAVGASSQLHVFETTMASLLAAAMLFATCA
ncbi:hypothetical protein BDW02DRAFT_281202 [Decorospora gaudefroyi]|uniref:Extracellular membrane protein CFEM domain-containing protein n=1 Tax=Decorospora gaudefroyi TaxID=184978 RepID=A0A6A5KJ68_9PLEO|nr:hypothetical protein BDW02DRAFT_281202 [Decorospora gaudefroyi]